MLAGLIDQQYSRLGGMTALGQLSAAGVGNAGIQTGENVANLMGQAAAAQAGGQLGSAKAYGNFLNLPAQFLGMQMGAGNKPGF
jgi:predicted component of type VI protein secretion system